MWRWTAILFALPVYVLVDNMTSHYITGTSAFEVFATGQLPYLTAFIAMAILAVVAFR